MIPEPKYSIKEEWKPILGFEELYFVSNLGRIKNRNTGRILDGSLQGKGYRRVFLSGGIRKDNLVHRLVAIAFIPNLEDKPCVNHIDGDRTNNVVSNLEWATYRENNFHSIKEGRRVYLGGEMHPTAKLILEEAAEIKNSNLKWKDLAKKFSVSMSTVAGIKSGRNWSTI